MAATLEDFVVFERLTVHEIRVKRDQVQATYTVLPKGKEPVSNTLMYAYPSPIFDPKSPEDLNLASMMLAQVAMNYGLFCKELVFEGLYDETDRSFINDMVENTSREIYVNKLLVKNEFIKQEYRDPEVQTKKRYTAAEIRFVDVVNSKWKPEPTSPDQNKYAILSSGGKDSLLSYGILNELFEAHPVYVNESGRHWYTAYNAYHGMQKIEPNTLKVWCNSDRIFNWMVRQVPFIRENFQNIRADIYPIRLWTVAVFLFGVLPVARKRGIKNVIIGNEYDTTLQLNYKGITHYAALYDQSKYFDNALSRYYKRKGWNMVQFSLLRSMSELLILKTLVKRYPHLQQWQVSCHAAHKEGERMYPCGKCEKCRRIVGMLSALDEDPKRCGYTDTQIVNGLKALESQKVKQIGTDAQQLYHLLVSKGLVEKNDHTRAMARENKEILQLRFDNERSMIEDLPRYIRKPVLDVLREYSDGATMLKNRRWEEINVNDLPLEMPYKIEKT